jgi:hypothetical protein
LLCTVDAPDEDGVYRCPWDTSLYHSDIEVIAYDIYGNQSDPLLRSAIVDLSGNALPNTGLSAWYYLLGLLPAGLLIIGRRLSKK